MLIQSFAKDIYSKGVSAVNENDTLSRCLDFFKTETPQVLAVVDSKGNYVGVITRRWILRSKLDPVVTKVKSLMKSAPKVSPDYTISKIAKLMIESGIRQLPVFENEKLFGFVTDDDVIRAAVGQEWGKNKVSGVMTRAPYTIDANRSVGAVMNLFREQGFSHVPVMDAGKVVGIISIRDILERIFQPNERQTTGDRTGEKVEIFSIPARSIMSSPIIAVEADTNLRETEKKMQKYNVSCLAATLNDRLLGIITKLDFLEPISQSETTTPTLTIQFSVKDTRITKDQQAFMMDEFDTFTRKYQEAFQTGTLFVYIKTHRTSNSRETPFVHCRLQFRTAKGTFVSSGESWGVETTFRTALDRMDRRLLRSKELSYNPRYAKDYLRKMGLPDEEL
ncbi:MAG: CBS domain-containing protein [Nitrososphaerota archaeon]|jgi:predicted transcriptional regulator|nr:CBS domain-containing protein [Nitrososphaerota archaeon]